MTTIRFIPLPGTPLAHTMPGAPDRETLHFLENLTLEKQELGRWKGRLTTLASMEMLPEYSGSILAQPSS